MLKKAVQSTFFGKQPLIKTAQRSIITYPDKNYVTPESMEDVIQYLDKEKPTYTLLYFTAKWNPVIPKIEKDYENTTKQFQ